MTKVAVAMSGGVDSSVAAALAVEKYGKQNVFGITMKLFGDENEAASDAAFVCEQLGIYHHVVNFGKEFEKEIIGNFISEYEQGRTPNPCIRCNSVIKFGYLLKKAQELGADILATGHYARIVFHSVTLSGTKGPEPEILDSSVEPQNDGAFRLFRGLDVAKDQSYFLYNLNQDQLEHVWFPLGELTKPEVRKLAAKYNLKTAKKTESQDICFVATTTQEFLKNRVGAKPGNMVKSDGQIVGKHLGLPFYTIGQRRGFGGGFAEPLYVIGLDRDKNEVVVGVEGELYHAEMTVGDISWVGKKPELPCELDVKIRYNSEASSATLSSVILTAGRIQDLDSSVRPQNDVSVKFTSPQRAITPGQTAVFYDGDQVVGGGIIQSVH